MVRRDGGYGYGYARARATRNNNAVTPRCSLCAARSPHAAPWVARSTIKRTIVFIYLRLRSRAGAGWSSRIPEGYCRVTRNGTASSMHCIAQLNDEGHRTHIHALDISITRLLDDTLEELQHSRLRPLQLSRVHRR